MKSLKISDSLITVWCLTALEEYWAFYIHNTNKRDVQVTAADLNEVHESIVAVLQEVHTKLSQEEPDI